jgi:hypothetical protein
MTHRLLILEPDRTFAERLANLLAELRGAEVTVTPNTKDACLHLMQNRQDLAFVPVTEGDKIIRALRAVQPDVRLVVMVPTAGVEVPDKYFGKVQGVLLKSNLDVDLAAVIDSALNQPFPLERTLAAKMASSGPSLDIAILIATLQRAKLGRLVQSTVLAQGTTLVAHWGDMNATQAATVALRVGEGWISDSRSARIQFLHLPARAGDMLLYTRWVHEDFLLTLVALPETPLSELRVQSDPLVAGLSDVLTGKTTSVVIEDSRASTGSGDRVTYAIVWCPIEPLPTSLHIPLRRAIGRLAATNGCVLRYNVIQSELVHLVVTCPPGRDSAWAAFLFKNGSETTIQQEFSVAATLWDTGYYATESADPLSTAELNLFLEHGSAE